MNVNKHTQSLFPYIYFATPEMQKKYCNGYEIYSEKWISENSGDSIFSGILFRDNKVYALNIEILCKDDDYIPQYLEMTKTFNSLLKEYNIYYLCLLISGILRKKYYKDSTLAQKLRLYVKYDRPYRLPKFRYAIEKHHSRHRKFYYNTKNSSQPVWDKIIRTAFHEVCNLCAYHRTSGKERPDLFFDYSISKPVFYTTKDSIQPSGNVRDRKERKQRRGYAAFKIKNGRFNWDHSSNT